MTLEDQRELIKLIDKYNNTDKKIIQKNIINLLDESGYKNNFVADKVGVTEHAVYGWRKTDKYNTPTFEKALKLVDLIGVKVTELLKCVYLI